MKLTIYIIATVIYLFLALYCFFEGKNQTERDKNDNQGHDPYAHLHKGWHNTPVGYWFAVLAVLGFCSWVYWGVKA